MGEWEGGGGRLDELMLMVDKWCCIAIADVTWMMVSDQCQRDRER